MLELTSSAEKKADSTRHLPAFKEVNVIGIKANVAEMLSLIGREGIFSTYSLHDISHIDAMLTMMDWLVPPSTWKAMTDTDWLMLCLAVYLHDLGLLVTQEEFETRNNNPEFRRWFDSLPNTSEGRDYVARAHRMTADEKERFFFQEYIRMGHAARAKEWITGRHSRKWGDKAKIIADEVADILSKLPVRFRDYLGTVCESHHKDNLDNVDLFPLCARCGNDPREIVNVQYAAILLRTADLLHVTKDRTPSRMFQLIKISDPKGVDEWDKQLGTFAVGPKGRKLIEGDSESAIIVMHADFTEERPFFALQEYVAYGDSQIQLSKRWAERSQLSPDAREYSFPWHALVGDIRLEGVPPQRMRFDLHRGRLLDLLVGHTIYNDATVAIRELLQNSIDAVRYRYYLDLRGSPPEGVSMGATLVTWDPESRDFVVQDNGVGMDRDVIENHLMKVGASYYNTPQFEADHGDFTPISRFGIGILTCFMISDDIEIVTFKGDLGHRIRMTSVEADYLLRDLEPGAPELAGLEPHGTRVRLRVRDTVDFTAKSVLDILRHWVILPECAVSYLESGRDTVTVGFTSAAAALEFYHRTSDEANKRVHTVSWREVLTKTRTGENIAAERPKTATYELAFAVEHGALPERFFAVQPPKVDLPMVCIEGIRVSGTLPWFEGGGGHNNLSTLLSVRGDKRFRTTVSRSGLEQDDDYSQVGKGCAEMLFEHVKDEVARISTSAGRPLSQASTASQWLYHDLTGRVVAARARTHLERLYSDLPSIVVERVEQKDGPQSTRSMVSPKALATEPLLWTVESRLVDSLGNISRDLGRELSVNEFLSALAPDLKQLRYSPIVPDAHLFQGTLEASHQVDRVEFSRRHQQSALRWVIPSARNVSRVTDLAQLSSSRYVDALNRALRESRSRATHDLFSEDYLRPGLPDLETKLTVQIAELFGDDSNVQVVITRYSTVIRTATPLASSWQSLIDCVRTLVAEEAEPPLVLDLMQFGSFLLALMRGAPTGVGRRPSSRAGQDLFDSIQERLETSGHSVDLAVDLERVGERASVFDATAYWRDWSKGHRG
jgi:molecular chaperone HtpG